MVIERETLDVQHSIEVRHMLDSILRQVWRHMDRAVDPPAQELFAKTIAVVDDLKTAYEKYESNSRA